MYIKAIGAWEHFEDKFIAKTITEGFLYKNSFLSEFGCKVDNSSMQLVVQLKDFKIVLTGIHEYYFYVKNAKVAIYRGKHLIVDNLSMPELVKIYEEKRMD